MLVRPEEERDKAAVREIVATEFDTGAEADFVAALRAEARPVVSLVAEEEREVVGYVLFSPVSLVEHPDTKLMGIAPLAVVPERQDRGIGSALVLEGLERCRALGVVGVVALGHTEYYARFGFERADRFGIRCRYDVPDGAFLLLELVPGALNGKTGTVTYHPAFNRL